MMFRLKLVLPIILILLLGYFAFALFKSPPLVKPTLLPLKVTTTANLAWPSSGQAAVGVLGTNILDTNGTQTSAPTASTAKLITALMVLKAKPLILGEAGPTITLGDSDVSIYSAYLAEDGSVVPVTSGEQISEYQMLEAMLLPSANNMADSLAIWSYGSLSAYSTAANAYVKNLGLSGTRIGADASGFLPTTVSNAADLVKIGEIVMQNPVLAEIVDEPSASNIPVAGTIRNVNNLLGQDNIVGVKTGNTDQAGGVFVGAVKFSVNNDTKIIVTADVGAATLSQALSDSATLIKSVQGNFKKTVLVHAGQIVAEYALPWKKEAIPVIADNAVEAYVWGGGTFSISPVKIRAITYPASINDRVGSVDDASLNSLSTNLSIDHAFPRPSIWWRLSHP